MENWEWILLLVGGLILAVLLSGFLGNIEAIPVSYIIYIITVLSFWESENIIRVLRLKSSKLVATNFDSTTDGTYLPCGDYAIFTLGDIDYMFHYKSNKGCIVVPRDAINKLGKNVVLCVNPTQVYFNELPPEARDKVKEYGIEPPYYLGFVSERQELVEPDVTRLEIELRERNTLLNMLRDIGKGKFETVGDIVEFLKRVKEETREKSWLEKVLIGEEEKKEEKKE
jgi:hypothetical protein